MRDAAFVIPALALVLATGARAEPFYPSRRLDWTVSAEKIKDDCASARARADVALREVAELDPSSQSFSNTPGAIEAALDDFYDATAGDAFLKDVAVSPAVRQAGRDCQTVIDKYVLEVFNREDLYKAVKSYAEKGEKPQGEDKKLLEKELLDFKRNGLELPAERRGEVKKMRERIVEIQQEFAKNVDEVKDSLLVTRTELEGLPQDYIDRLEKVDNKYRVTVDYPDYFPFMENARDAYARQRLQFLFDNRAAKENVPLFKEALRLRDKAARSLGYRSHADYVLADRMAKTTENVEAFLHRLRAKLKPLGKAELKVLLELKKQEEGAGSDGVIHAWDWRYYDNQLKKSRYNVDQERIKEYFPLDTVLSGMLSVYERLLGVTFTQVPDAAVWHPDVKLYKIADAAGGDTIAYFYMDLFPRDGKYKHAASFNIINGRHAGDGYQKPVAAIVANFPKPGKDRPSLLKHGAHQDVETIFHEFGHIMHQTLTKARYERFSGASVSWDFIEAPSQMLENWVWDPAVLASLSGSYRDPSKKLPEELLQKMIAARNLDTGLVQLRQAFFSEVDMRYHADADIKDPTAVYARLMSEVSLIPMNPGTNPEASFGHLFNGYDAGYYSYLWSKVYAQDMFSRFESEGLLNPAIGRQYRETVLAPGGSRDEMDLVRRFLGREPNEEAFLKSIGVGREKEEVLPADRDIQVSREPAVPRKTTAIPRQAGSLHDDAPGGLRSYALHSDVDKPVRRGKERPNDFALIVGIEDYQSLPKADYGVRDAQAVRKHLEALGVPLRNIVSLEGQAATKSKLQSYIEEWLPLNVRPDSTLFFYYSGHGAPDPKTGGAFLVPWDGDPKFLKTSAYSLKQLYSSLAKTKAKRILVALDSCFSGAGGRSVLAKGARPLVIKVDLELPPSGRLTVLAAASGDEITGTLDDQGHGLFTYYFLKGLDQGKESSRELFEFLKPNVEDEARRQNREQTPTMAGTDQRF